MAAGLVQFPHRGEIYQVDFSPSRGSEQNGERPGVVISTDFPNRTLGVVTLAAVTTNIRREDSPISFVLPAGVPLREKSCVLCFQIITVSTERLQRRLGILNSTQIEELNDRLKKTWGLV